MARRATSLVVAALVASTPVLVAGCTVKENTATVTPTTTTVAPSGDDADIPELPGADPATLRQALRSAVADRDLCALIAAVDLGVPTSTDGGAVVAAYQELADSLAAAESFRPVELRDAWSTVRAALDDALVELRATGGQADAPSVVAVFTTDAVQAASRRIVRWADDPVDIAQPDGPTHCPASGT